MAKCSATKRDTPTPNIWIFSAFLMASIAAIKDDSLLRSMVADIASNLLLSN